MDTKIEEIWKDIPGYSGIYQISSFGRVKSTPRNGTVLRERILALVRDTNGYVFYGLSMQHKRKYVSAHILVAKCFLSDSFFYGAVVNHKNGIKHDNRVENLEWCTQKENIAHYRNSLISAPSYSCISQ